MATHGPAWVAPLGAAQGLKFVAHTLHDTTVVPAGTVAVRFSVTAAGNVVCEDWDGNSLTFNFPAVGVYTEQSQGFKLIKSTSATATLSPATTVICHVQHTVRR